MMCARLLNIADLRGTNPLLHSSHLICWNIAGQVLCWQGEAAGSLKMQLALEVLVSKPEVLTHGYLESDSLHVRILAIMSVLFVLGTIVF